MNRIEPGRVVEAFRRLIPEGIDPIQDQFVDYSDDEDYEDDPHGVCGLTAVAMTTDAGGGDTAISAIHVTMADLDGMSTPQAAEIFGRALDVPFEYAFGFCHGWDNFTPRTCHDYGRDLVDHPEYKRGKDDGAAAWKAVHRNLP
jgi:hypothetical protein